VSYFVDLCVSFWVIGAMYYLTERRCKRLIITTSSWDDWVVWATTSRRLGLSLSFGEVGEGWSGVELSGAGGEGSGEKDNREGVCEATKLRGWS